MDEQKYISMLEDLLADGGFFYSPTWSITHTLQRQSSIGEGLKAWQAADERFFWNLNLVAPLIEFGALNAGEDLSNFIIPCIHGCK